MTGTTITASVVYKSLMAILKNSTALQTIAANTSKEATTASGGEAAAVLNKAAAITKDVQSIEVETVAKSANASASSVAKKSTATEIAVRETPDSRAPMLGPTSTTFSTIGNRSKK